MNVYKITVTLEEERQTFITYIHAHHVPDVIQWVQVHPIQGYKVPRLSEIQSIELVVANLGDWR